MNNCYNPDDQLQTFQAQQQQQIVPPQLSKSDLLKWVSLELGFQVSNIQRFQSGTLIVLLLAKTYQHDQAILSLILKSANLKAKVDVDFIQNYKLIFKMLAEYGYLQTKGSMDAIDKLIKGKVNETIDFIQLIKKVYDQNKQPQQNNLNQKLLQQIFEESQIIGIEKDLQKKQLFQDSTQQRLNAAGQYTSTISNKSSLSNENAGKAQFDKFLQKSSQISGDLEHLITENQDMKRSNLLQKLKTKAAEKERDFYFGKLRDIELLLMEEKRDSAELLKAVQKILYAKEDENIEVDEEGNILV